MQAPMPLAPAVTSTRSSGRGRRDSYSGMGVLHTCAPPPMAPRRLTESPRGARLALCVGRTLFSRLRCHRPSCKRRLRLLASSRGQHLPDGTRTRDSTMRTNEEETGEQIALQLVRLLHQGTPSDEFAQCMAEVDALPASRP